MLSSFSLWAGSSPESCAASSPSSSPPASPSTGLNGAAYEPTDAEWLEEKRANFVRLLNELAAVDARLLPWADRAESAPLAAFMAYMRFENAAVAEAPPEQRQDLALKAVDRAALLLGADTDAAQFISARINLARYTILFATS